ncbi:MAG: hypothetical protein C4294_20350, partial [Nitrospiraceae bacterium]
VAAQAGAEHPGGQGRGAPPNFDLNYYNKRGLEKQQGKSVEQLKAELAAGHADTLQLLDELSDADLDPRGKHPRGEMTIEEIFRIIALHDREHTGHIAEAVKR